MIIGTAGHIDHGKTSLVKAITGVDADRLKEEKARGITIELGFAYWPQQDGSVVGFVDVPGHERFVHTMLAGAHGLDVLLLVVAADDGVMPQTREHLDIVTLLGIDRAVVALTKVDAVAPERAAEAAAEVTALLAETPLAGSPVFPLSSLTGQGVQALQDWLQLLRGELAGRDASRLFRLAVDRSFILAGTGVVVTGSVLDGRIAVGDAVQLSPSGLTARVRSLHAQNRRAESGAAGDRCALNLAGPGIEKSAIHRGEMVLAAESHAPTQRIDALLRVAAGAPRGLLPWMPARLHHATAEVGARLLPLQDTPPQPGEEALVQLVLDRPIAARALDRFILRDVSATRTLAGGRLLDLRAPDRKRRSPERRAVLAALALPDAVAALAALAAASEAPVELDIFARDRGASPPIAEAWCDAAGLESWRLGNRHYAMAQQRRGALASALRLALAQFHADNPDLPGMGLERLRLLTAPRLPAPLFRTLLRGFAADGWLVLDGAWLRLASHRIEITPVEQELWEEIRPMLSAGERFRPPRVRDIARSLQEDEDAIRRLLRRFRQAAALDEIAHDHFFLRPVLTEMVRELPALQQAGDGWFTAAQFRDRLEAMGGGTVGRKVAIQVLEFLDRHGVTLRRGDLRRINPHRQDLFEPAEDAPALPVLVDA